MQATVCLGYGMDGTEQTCLRITSYSKELDGFRLGAEIVQGDSGYSPAMLFVYIGSGNFDTYRVSKCRNELKAYSEASLKTGYKLVYTRLVKGI